MISGMISGTRLSYLVPVQFLDLAVLLKVLWTNWEFRTNWEFSSIKLTARTCAHGASIDITQQCSSHLRTIHDKCIKKCEDTAHSIICKSKINIPWAQVIDVLNDPWIHGATPDACAEAIPRLYLCTLTPWRIGRIANGRHAYAFDITDLSLLRHLTAERNRQPYNKTRNFTISGMISG